MANALNEKLRKVADRLSGVSRYDSKSAPVGSPAWRKHVGDKMPSKTMAEKVAKKMR